MVDHALRTLGHGPVGRYTSPHHERVGERIRLDGRALPDDVIQRTSELYADAYQRITGEPLSAWLERSGAQGAA
jgi:folylpolyglutamate synthase/dihydropteroate synthase